MSDNHIIELLEGERLTALSDAALAEVRAHVEQCTECSRAYTTALVSDSLLCARAEATIEPSPFFATRVMAALRERAEPAPLRWMWSSARALVSTMVLLVAILIGVTIIGGSDTSEASTDLNIYSTEAVVFDEDYLADDGVALEAVIATVYEAEELNGN